MRWIGVLLLGACGFHSHEVGVVDSQEATDGRLPIEDAHNVRIDAPPDAPPDAANCFGTGLFAPCLTALPSGDLNVAQGTTTTVSTDTDCTRMVSQTGGPDVCLITYNNISIDGTLQASGSHPLALLATGTIAIGANGQLDVGSYRVGSTPHAGAGEGSASLCGSPGTPGGDASGAGGGAGGSFVGKGGDGAIGMLGAGGGGSTALTASGTPSVVRGGCPGVAGATSTVAGGGFGHGGGAVYLIARTSITNAGTILACGGGGDGAGAAAGGGGGGAGGFIGLDSASVTSTGVLDALGGGGGEGGGMGGGYNGSSGLSAAAAAAGGTGNSNGGDGGDGAFATPDGVSGHQGNMGGGGGGGASGAIRVFPSQSLGGTVAPAAS